MATQAARGMANDAAAARRFEVALSYPGEHRDYVAEVASHLAETFSQDRVLYDRYHDAEFARADLDIYLPGLYREQSELIVLFLCPEYAGKRWCRLEWRQIRQLIATVQAQRIMFLSFGDPGDLSALGILDGDGYIDLQALAPQAAAQKILTRLRVNRGGAQPVAPATATPAAPAASGSVKVDIDRIIKYAPAELIGREDELKLLDDAWGQAVRGEARRPHVMTFVALGGEGKTSLVAKWAAQLAHEGWPGCEAAFAWSFYSQGTREQMAASSDLFLAEALRFFGDAQMAQSSQSAFDKARRLARLVGGCRALLLLDGVEPLQYAPTSPMPGELKDQALATLLKALAASGQSLCVLTTRYTIPDLKAFRQNTAPETMLTRLSQDAGVRLLRTLGVTGTEQELQVLVDDVQGHALTLNLLGSYLHAAHGGDVRKRDLVQLEEADAESEHGGHAFRVMDAYIRWFSTGGKSAEENRRGQRAISVLQMMGLFDRPATADCLAALLKAPAISGLTEPFVSLTVAQHSMVYTRLEIAKLLTINRNAAGVLVSLDAHPLLREYFGKQLRMQQPETWRAAHRRLYEHLYATTKEGRRPSLEDLQPLYQAIAHGCQAEIQQETCNRVFQDRILRRNERFSTQKLAAYGSDLGAVACFFEVPWNQLSQRLTDEARAWMLGQASFLLRAVGRLGESLEPLQAGLRMVIEQKDWKNAAVGTGNLSELELTLGQIDGEASAVRDAEKSVAYAERSGDAFHRMSKRTTYADALHQAGRQAESFQLFREAETLQAEMQPEGQLLYSFQGFRYCDLLLAPAECNAWRASLQCRSPSSRIEALDDVVLRATYALQIAMNENWILDIALDHLTLGRALLYKAILQGASHDTSPSAWTADGRIASEINQAMNGLHRTSGQFIPLGPLSRAWLRTLQGHLTGSESAQTDLDEAWEVAERGPMPLFQVDVHLHRARLFYREASYPWQSAAHDLAEARRLIFKHGYLRRQQELEDAEAVILHGATSLPPLAEWQ